MVSDEDGFLSSILDMMNRIFDRYYTENVHMDGQFSGNSRSDEMAADSRRSRSQHDFSRPLTMDDRAPTLYTHVGELNATPFDGIAVDACPSSSLFDHKPKSFTDKTFGNYLKLTRVGLIDAFQVACTPEVDVAQPAFLGYRIMLSRLVDGEDDMRIGSLAKFRRMQVFYHVCPGLLPICLSPATSGGRVKSGHFDSRLSEVCRFSSWLGTSYIQTAKLGGVPGA